MKAVIRLRYGTPEKVLSIKEIVKPTPKDDEVLKRVYATSANRSDYHVLTSKPFFMRFFTGLFHAEWPINKDYMAPPTMGQLVAHDPALLVTSPKGKEVGFVPIVTHQQAASK